MTDLPRVHRPCDACPWRTTATPGRFTSERWRALRETSYDRHRGSAEMGAPLFACHKTDAGRDRVCAGWLAQEGVNHIGIRLHVLSGDLPAEALEPGEDWPPLFQTLAEAAEHDLSGSLEEG